MLCELRPKDIPKRVTQCVEDQIQAANQEALRAIHRLTPLQSAVLRVLAAAGADDAPLESDTQARYQQVLSTIAPDSEINFEDIDSFGKTPLAR